MEKGKEKLLEALVFSEIDSENTENYADQYKRSRQNRAKINPSAENIKSNEKEAKRQKTTELTQPSKQKATANIGQLLGE